MDAVGIDEIFRAGRIGGVDRVECRVSVGDDERIRIAVHGEHGVKRAVQSLDEQIAETMQAVESDLEPRRLKSVARPLLDERGVNVHDGVVDGLEDDERVGVEPSQSVHDRLDVFHRPRGGHSAHGVPVQNAVDGSVFVFRGFQDDVVHGDRLRLERAVHPVLQHVVAEDGNVDDVRLADVKKQPARPVVVEVFILKNGSEILGEVPGNGMVVIGEIVPSADDVGIGVLMPEPEGGRPEDALRDGVAEIDDLRLALPFILVAGGERRYATSQQCDDEQRGNDLLFHISSLSYDGKTLPLPGESCPPTRLR